MMDRLHNIRTKATHRSAVRSRACSRARSGISPGVTLLYSTIQASERGDTVRCVTRADGHYSIGGITLLVLLSASGAATGQEVTTNGVRKNIPSVVDAQCLGPIQTAAVRAQRKNKISIHYMLEGSGSSPVVRWILGDGEKLELRTNPWSVPASVLGPKGWTGRVVYLEESEYMNIMWYSQNSKSAIRPARLMSGFQIDLPKDSPEKPQFYTDGSPVLPVDFA